MELMLFKTALPKYTTIIVWPIYLVTKLVVGRFGESDFGDFKFGCIIDDRQRGNAVRSWILNQGLARSDRFLGLAAQRLPVPVLLVLNPREPTS